MEQPLIQIATWIALVGFGVMAGFQLMLALGAPWGRLVWGGFHSGRLPPKLRLGSLASVGIYLCGIVAVLEATGRADLFESSIVSIGILWFLVVLFGFSTLGNLMSRSRLEKRVMTPVAMLFFLSCLVLAIGGRLPG